MFCPAFLAENLDPIEVIGQVTGCNHNPSMAGKLFILSGHKHGWSCCQPKINDLDPLGDQGFHQGQGQERATKATVPSHTNGQIPSLIGIFMVLAQPVDQT